jgi:HSP20 family molecular chaperone IbpA
MFNLPAMGMRDPFAEIERISRQMDLLSNALSGRPGQRFIPSRVFSAVNINEDNDKYYVSAELPGINADEIDLQVNGKQEVTTAAEQMRPGLVFSPAVDIFETDGEITLLADMPGVAADDLSIDLRDGTLTLSGEVKPWKGSEESDVLVEFEIGKYYRQFALSEVIDQCKIEAGLENGIVRLTLPKAEKAVSRKITVTTG